MCPVFDFANHVWDGQTMTPSRANASVRCAQGNAAKTNLVCSTDGKNLREGAELLLTYGAHSNGTLFVEYGFVNSVSEAEMGSGRYCAEAIVDDIVTDLIRESGGNALLSVAQALLEEWGYWGCVVLHVLRAQLCSCADRN
jgi:hypothetical protein